MTLRIRALEIRVNTDGPTCGTRLQFADGLNVLRADNSSGKSTCLQAIVYALGLEGMLSSRRHVPLPHSVTDRITVPQGEFDVTDSLVRLQVENGNGETLTVERSIKNSSVDTSLVRTWEGPLLTNPGHFPARDYFVRRAGAAQREAGFHNRLADFLGWDLPRVTRFDGSECPLYVESLFPFFYVEQKHGWTGVQARIPSYLGIRDVSKRATEFILALDAYQLALERQRLASAASEIQSEWRTVTKAILARCESAGVVARGLVLTVEAYDAAVENPVFSTSVSGEWIDLDDSIGSLRASIAGNEQQPVFTAAESAAELEEGLRAAQESLQEGAVRLRLASEDLHSLQAQRDNLDLRIEALSEDLQRHKDAALLGRLGSTLAGTDDATFVCPTCHQDLHDGMDISGHVMSVTQSIGHIERQLATFRAMRADADRAITARAAAVRSERALLSDLRTQIRAHADTLTGPSAAPSLAEVTARVQNEQKLAQLIDLRDELSKQMQTRNHLAALWATNRAMLATQDATTSPSDGAKLEHLQTSTRTQLRRYEFSSLDPSAIEISSDTYRPVYEGFDLGFDLSASDMVRLIWAYLIGILDTGMMYGSNHPRFLVFDEPKQQDTARSSYGALLAQAGDVAREAQILFATSEEVESLKEMLVDVPHTLLAVDPGEKLLRVLPH